MQMKLPFAAGGGEFRVGFAKRNARFCEEIALLKFGGANPRLPPCNFERSVNAYRSQRSRYDCAG